MSATGLSILSRALVPFGPFEMGGERDNERPVHRVSLSAFEMARVPVTNRHYAAYLNATSKRPPPWWRDPLFNRPDQPVVGVNWFEASGYVKWLSGESGLNLRLPTEAEREKAARGGLSQAIYPWGDDPASGGHPLLRGPLPCPEEVAQRRPNGYGLFNMGDSVHEWCLDGYLPDYYRVSPGSNPCCFLRTRRRSARGGSWRHQRVVTPCAARSSLPPELHYSDFGFRWVRVL